MLELLVPLSLSLSLSPPTPYEYLMRRERGREGQFGESDVPPPEKIIVVQTNIPEKNARSMD